jgi:hypothetical protein
MNRYSADSRVHVEAFQRQVEGSDVILGRPGMQAFIALPVEAVEFLDLLADGRTIREARALYAAKHGEAPDTEDFLEALEARGFVRPWGEAPANVPSPAHARAGPSRHHFTGFPEALARRLFGRVALGCHGLVITLGLVALCVEPSVRPSLRTLAPAQHFSAALLVMMALGFLTLFLHELAHLVAARAVGVDARMGISHRLWMLVAETDISGIWLVPRRKRYLPLLAGSLVDLTSAAVVVLVLFADARKWLSLSPLMRHLGGALLLMYFFRLLWQCYLFVRTDFYYVLANLFGCKNLMQDAQAWIRHRLRGLLGLRDAPDPLEDLPGRERRFVRAYTVIWAVGRLVAFAVLLTLQLPFLFYFFAGVYRVLSDAGSTRSEVADALLVSGFAVLNLLVGLSLWLKNLVSPHSQEQAR